jgi:two-component system, cell cycle sensor histidine kinase and response regulator CckA
MKTAPTIALVYLLAGFAWILFSDTLLGILLPSQEAYSFVQTVKGFAFVLLSAALIFFMIRSRMARILEATSALEKSERQFRSLVEGAPDAVFVQTEGRFAYVNAAALKLFGAESREELIDTPVLERFHPEFRDQVRRRIRQLNDLKQPVASAEETCLRLDGTEVPTEVSAVPLQFRGSNGALVFVRDISERKRSEAKLRQSDERLQLALDVVSDGVWDWRVDTGKVYFSPRWYTMLGYDHLELPELFETWKTLVHPDDLESTTRIIEARLKDGVGFEMQFRMRAKDGTWRWILGRGKVVERDGSGNPVRMLGTHVDITELRRAESALKESESRYKAIFNAIPDMVFQFDGEGVYIGYQGGRDLLLVPPERFIGKRFEEVLPQGVAARSREGLEAIAAGSEFFDCEYSLEIGGEKRSFDMRMFRVDQRSFMAMVRDITARKRSEEEILRLSGAVTHAAGGVIIISPDQIIQYVNPAFEKMSGYSASEIVGRKSTVLHQGLPVETGHHLHQEIWDKMAKGEVWTGRLPRVRRDGKPYAVEATVTPIRNEAGELVSVVSFWRDITHEEQLQLQLLQSQKMEAIGTLAGGIAHDFNNILSSIIGYSELAQMKARGNAALVQDLSMVLKAADRAKDLVRQILTFSRKGEQQKKTVNLVPLLREIVKMLRATIPSTIEIAIADETSSDLVTVDTVQMHQIVTNLCSNATHAMPMGGRIILRVRDYPCDAAALLPEMASSSCLAIEVTDTGSGMTSDVIGQIFDPFFTTKKPGEGTGMGLPVVHGIVTRHGGHITVTSEPGKGSTFTIVLPKAESAIPEEELLQERTLPEGKGRILFVDDEELLIGLAEVMLPGLGYSVETARDSLAALERVRGAPEAFDLVITDQTMPHMTGLELARELRRIREDLPILLSSGNIHDLSHEDMRAAGVKGFIQKPYRKDQMARAIQEGLQTGG